VSLIGSTSNVSSPLATSSIVATALEIVGRSAPVEGDSVRALQMLHQRDGLPRT
jgi:hypothetical protein